jgi:hypothetical protein
LLLSIFYKPQRGLFPFPWRTHISLLYFPIGNGNGAIYHGKTPLSWKPPSDNYKNEVARTRGYEFAGPLTDVWAAMHDVTDAEANNGETNHVDPKG